MKIDQIFSSSVNSVLSIFIIVTFSQGIFSGDSIAENQVPEEGRTAEYYYRVAKSYMRMGQRDKMMEAYREAINTDPDNPDYYLSLADSYMNSRPPQYKTALNLTEKAFRLDPDNYRTNQKLAGVYFSLGDYKRAIDLYEKSIKLNSNDPDSFIGLGFSYYYLHQFEKCIAAMKKVVDLDPEDYRLALAYELIGGCYLNLGNKAEAVRQYKILKTIPEGKSYADGLMNQIKGKTKFEPPPLKK